MKIRNGFVSNSSSSSFIISDKEFPTIKDIASYMINKKIEDYSYDNDYDDSWSYSDKKAISILDSIDKDQAVSFSSCNYDTYIRKVGDCYIVATCNNVDWELYGYASLTDNAKTELNKLLVLYEEGSDDHNQILDILENQHEEFSAFGKDFYDLHKEILGVETYDYCQKHENNYKHRLWDTVKFGKICLSCNPYYKRKEKLEKINTSINEN